MKRQTLQVESSTLLTLSLRSLFHRTQHDMPETRPNVSRNKHVVNLNDHNQDVNEIAKDIAFSAREYLRGIKTSAPLIVTTRKVASPKWWADVSRSLPDACKQYGVMLLDPVMENEDESANIVYIFAKVPTPQ